MQSPESWRKHLLEAKTHFKNANHLAYVTLTVLKENRLLLKILTDLHQSSVHLIKAYLYHYAFKNKVELSKDPLVNLNFFIEVAGPVYLKETEINLLVSILRVAKKHKDSPLEFIKRDKFIIFNNGSYETVSIDTIKSLISGLSKAISSFPEEA